MHDIIKPSILPGFLELLPQEQEEMNKIIEKIENVYKAYRFQPIDTPIIEKEEILLAKGGGETEKQIYRVAKDSFPQALRFDLTVPLARYVAQHFNELVFPFKRYQIGKVFRGERAQRGRYREFYQCDIDIVGKDKLSILNDAELVKIIYSVFKELEVNDFEIKISNRKVLFGFLEGCGIKDKTEIMRTIDKLEKIGTNNVRQELLNIGLEEDCVETLLAFISQQGNNKDIITYLRNIKCNNDIYKEGVKELADLISYIEMFHVPKQNYQIDLRITRGLDYYTGFVCEAFLRSNLEIGSVCSGGRYDNLAEYYSRNKLPGVGVSIGLTRLFTILKDINKNEFSRRRNVLVISMDDSCIEYAIKVSEKLRQEGLSLQLYYEDMKLKKKMLYADKKEFKYVIIVGSDERQSESITVKNLDSGEQERIKLNDININKF